MSDKEQPSVPTHAIFTAMKDCLDIAADMILENYTQEELGRALVILDGVISAIERVQHMVLNVMASEEKVEEGEVKEGDK